MGEKQNQPLRLSFNTSSRVDFQGSRVTSECGHFVGRGRRRALKNPAGQLHAEAIGVMLPVAQKSKWKCWLKGEPHTRRRRDGLYIRL
jgi:hypothetical protein